MFTWIIRSAFEIVMLEFPSLATIGVNIAVVENGVSRVQS